MSNCKLCLIKTDDYIEINGKKGVELNIEQILSLHFWFDEIKQSSETDICCECWKKVFDFNKFYQTIKQKHEFIEKITLPLESVDITKLYPTDGEYNNYEIVKDTKAADDIDENDEEDYGENDDCVIEIDNINDKPLNIEEIKVESLNECDILSDGNQLEDPTFNDDENNSNSSSWSNTNSDDSMSDDIPLADRQRKRTTKKINNKLITVEKRGRGSGNTRNTIETYRLIRKFCNLSCDKCAENNILIKFNKFSDAISHYTKEHNLNGYLVCCKRRFFKLSHIKQHCEWHIDPNKFKCNDCNKIFKDKICLTFHQNRCHAPDDEKIFKCNLCDKSFSKRHLLKKHSLSHVPIEPEKLNKKLENEANTKKYAELMPKYFTMECDLCSTKFLTFNSAREHYQTNHNQKGYLFCCNKKFFHLFQIIEHCNWHEDPDIYKCEQCSKKYTDGYSLREHVINIHATEGDRIYKCEICGKGFSRKFLLSAHQRLRHIKDEDKKFECDLCGQKFAVLPILRKHIKRVHEYSDSCVCHICSKFFKCTQSYELHYSIEHTNTMQKVQCEKCGRWLKHKGTLVRHMRWHAYDKTSATCTICDKVLSSERALKAHIKLIHIEPAFKCTVCDKMFKKKIIFKEHMAMHAGITDLYSCTFCPKTFRSNSNMYKHRKKCHPKEYAERNNGNCD